MRICLLPAWKTWLYGYYLKDDGTPEINTEQAEAVKFMFARYMAGDSTRIIASKLDQAGVPTPSGKSVWEAATIKAMLKNEKYCGDVLAQKTFKDSVIGGKIQKNTGQLPQVLVQNNHPAIISRELYYEVQEEMKRRTAAKCPSTKSSTGRTRYSSKYALSERLVCGECGTLYRRCTWNIRGKKKIVWRCVSRLDHGTKYCKQSPTMEEAALQTAIMDAINRSMDTSGVLARNAAAGFLMILKPQENAEFTLGEVKRRIQELTAEFDALFEMDGSEETEQDRFTEITLELAELKKKQESISAQLHNNQGLRAKVNSFASAAERLDHHMTEWDEEFIRQMIHTVEVISVDRIRVVLTDGTVIMQEVHNQ